MKRDLPSVSPQVLFWDEDYPKEFPQRNKTWPPLGVRTELLCRLPLSPIHPTIPLKGRVKKQNCKTRMLYDLCGLDFPELLTLPCLWKLLKTVTEPLLNCLLQTKYTKYTLQPTDRTLAWFLCELLYFIPLQGCHTHYFFLGKIKMNHTGKIKVNKPRKKVRSFVLSFFPVPNA